METFPIEAIHTICAYGFKLKNYMNYIYKRMHEASIGDGYMYKDSIFNLFHYTEYGTGKIMYKKINEQKLKKLKKQKLKNFLIDFFNHNGELVNKKKVDPLLINAYLFDHLIYLEFTNSGIRIPHDTWIKLASSKKK